MSHPSAGLTGREILRGPGVGLCLEYTPGIVKNRGASSWEKKELKFESPFRDPKYECPKWWLIANFRD